MKEKIKDILINISMILLIFGFVLLAHLMTSCKSVERVVRTSDTIRVADTLVVRDTVKQVTREKEIIEREIVKESVQDYHFGKPDKELGYRVDTVVRTVYIKESNKSEKTLIDSLSKALTELHNSSAMEKKSDVQIKTEVRYKDSRWGLVGKWLTGLLTMAVLGVVLWFIFYAKSKRR